MTFPAQDPSTAAPLNVEREQFYARVLTSLYYNKNPSMFSDLVSLAETIAISETAIAALTLLRAIITSNWSPSSSSNPPEINPEDPTYTRIISHFPVSGLAAILDPTISGPVLPYLIKPATKYSNLVGGAGGAENAAYQVAMAKFDVLKALESRLVSVGDEADARVREVTAMVRRRVSQGPWGVGGEAGSRIGTLEM